MAVAFDAVGPGSTGTTTQGTTLPLSVSWTHVCSGTERAAVVSVAVGVPSPGNDTNVTASATFGGTAMVSLGRKQSNNDVDGYVQLFGLVNPPAGSSTVVLTVSGSASSSVTIAVATGSVSFNGVDQTTPFDSAVSASASTGAPTVVVPSSVGDMVVDGVANGATITSSNQTQRWLRNVNSSSAAGNGASSTASGAASVTMSYVATDDWSAIIGVNVNQYVPPADPVPVAWLTV